MSKMISLGGKVRHSIKVELKNTQRKLPVSVGLEVRVYNPWLVYFYLASCRGNGRFRRLHCAQGGVWTRHTLSYDSARNKCVTNVTLQEGADSAPGVNPE